MRYGIRNVMPPNSAKRAGNIQIFAKPIAEPTQARSIPMFVLKSSRFCFIFYLNNFAAVYLVSLKAAPTAFISSINRG